MINHIQWNSIWGDGEHKRVAQNILKFQAVRERRKLLLAKEELDIMTYDLPKDKLGFKDFSTPLSRLGTISFRKLMIRFFAGITLIDILNTIVAGILMWVLTIAILSI